MNSKTKTLRKLLILVSCAVLLVCISVGATLAFLTSKTQVVENTFTVGNVRIDLDEAAVQKDEETDNIVPVEGADRVKVNSYHLLPGISYAKDPRVTVKMGSEECYVRALVTVSNRNELDTLFAQKKYNIKTIVTGLSEAWEVYGNTVDATNNTRTYELRYNTTVDAFEAKEDIILEPLFTAIVMPGDITKDELATLAGLKIDIVAHAIQADGFADADAAWKSENVDWAALAPEPTLAPATPEQGGEENA